VRDPSFYVSGILDLHKLYDAGERRATWRQSMTALARLAAEEGPGPLDALHPDALVEGVRAALASKLVDDLDWLAPSAASVALYELASALPVGPEQRDIGRRVLARLLAGNAESFVALATRMALGSTKGLASPAARARIALTMDLPIGAGVADGPLALALASRRELAREWIAEPSTHGLPARRLAARILERAAREAARRAQQGDDHAVRVFRGDSVAPAWARLLADREPLVWRHVATARGLLAPWVPAWRGEIDDALAPDLPTVGTQPDPGRALRQTAWRRAAASIAAEVAVSPEAAVKTAKLSLEKGGLLDRDPGAAAAFVWGIGRAAEAEPDAAAELLELVLDRRPAEVGEAVVELRMEYGEALFVERAMRRARAEIERHGRRRSPGASGAWSSAEDGDDGAEGLAMEIARDLERAPRDDQPVREQLARALLVFAQDGARAAYAAAKTVLEGVQGEIDALDAVSREDEEMPGTTGSLARRASLAVLRDLDVTLLERATLADLLRLGSAADAVHGHEEALDAIHERLTDWILQREGAPLSAGAQPLHPTLSLRRLRALLRLVDSDLTEAADDPARVSRARARGTLVARVLAERFEKGPPSVLRRTIVAALARALDALVRASVCDPSDAFLLVAHKVQDSTEFATLAEASMNPDLCHMLGRYAAFTAVCAPPKLKIVAKPDSAPPSDFPVVSLTPVPSLQALQAETTKKLRALEDLAKDVVPDASVRTEALRTALVKLHAALQRIANAPSLRALASATSPNEPEAVTTLESALAQLTSLVAGARARLDPERTAPAGVAPTTARPLTVAVSRVLAGTDAALSSEVLAASLPELLAPIPKAIGQLVSSIVWSLMDLVVDRPSADAAPIRISVDTLPQWLPPRRTLGGFYVIRSLSAGAVGSVFVVTRVEDRNDPMAERFALKVPEYSVTAARSVSEADFLKMFREEASALMAVPQHPNLARFVTFDAGSRPKPILVMELVEGMSLDRVIATHALDAPRAFQVLDDVLAGLDAMHGVGVGHLDLKPSNVVLRKGEEAVLVDFGLAGRHVRLGCATGPYGAPEVWGALAGTPSTPMPADVYAFGCLAFEVLTTRTLFEADNEMAQIALHVAHDGMPPGLRELSSKHKALGPLAELLFATLRREPKNRATVPAVRAELRKIAPLLARQKWPLA
jgi:hypothetical protein